MTGIYSPHLVLASYLVAVAAAFAALNIAGRISQRRANAVWWRVFGGLVLGAGIWSMHFIGMLAFELPIAVGYDLELTVLSLLLAMGASILALWLASAPAPGQRRLAFAAGVLGGGIAWMHYAGMASMQMQPPIDYHPGWVAASIVVAMLAAGVGLQMAHLLRQERRGQQRRRLLAALVIGLAIVGMHYTGMAAARFDPASWCGAAVANGMSRGTLAILVGAFSVVLLGGAIVLAMIERRIEERSHRLSSSLFEANEQLAQLAWYDPLTGLPNRSQLQGRLDALIVQRAVSRRPFAVYFVDLDGFKGVNDAFGHDQGDQLLVEVSRRIRGSLGDGDMVARLGGDEFVVLAEVDGPTGAESLAATIASRLAAAVQIDSGMVTVSASIGIALFPRDGASARQLLANADSAMYHVKERGRNGHGFFNAGLHLDAQAQMALVQDLRGAAERGELFLVYQPKVRAPDRALVGAEALLRWRHPVRGVVMPDTFIPLAERYGMIIGLGRWVLVEACRQLAAWRKAGWEVPHVAVNLSAVQFRSANLVEDVMQVLRAEGLRGEDLVVEVTETMALQDPEASLVVLNRLAAEGVRISIDDFGVGYSSLEYLKRLPVCELKVDRSFVGDLVEDPRNAAIIELVVGLGRRFGLDVIAEGVETEAQWRLLVELGCARMQGYLLGYPYSGEGFIAQLRSGAHRIPGSHG